jgi:hypothetical protein
VESSVIFAMPRSSVIVLLALQLLLLLTTTMVACGSSVDERDAEPATKPLSRFGTVPAAESNLSCSGNTTAPLEQDVVAESLRHHAFSVQLDSHQAICGSGDPKEDIPIVLTNMLFFGPSANIADHATVETREGHVICSLRRAAIYGDAFEIQEVIRELGRTKFVLANLECFLYSDLTYHDKHRVRLRRALEDLSPG